MRYLVLLLCLATFFGCNDYPNITSDEIVGFEAQFYRKEFLESKMKNNFEVLDLESFGNFEELLVVMETLSCEDKSIGLQFEFENASYHAIGFTECPTSGEIACYFNQNMVFVKNDSIRHLGFESETKHISELKTEIITFNDYSEYHRLNGSKRLKPVLVLLNVENKFPISKTKEVIKEIVRQFEDVNKELGTEKYRYYLSFERYSNFDFIPPPPPFGY